LISAYTNITNNDCSPQPLTASSNCDGKVCKCLEACEFILLESNIIKHDLVAAILFNNNLNTISKYHPTGIIG
jgi:hypothetical protein